jgi:molybdenum cofactor guanylyltransferase
LRAVAPVPERDAAGFVLAGGRSSRMGTEKARLVLAAKTLIERSLHTLRQAGLESSIAGARSDLSAYAPVVSDAAEDAGPLGGLCAAMAASPGQWAVFVPVDLPLLPASLLSYLLHHARTTGAGVTVASVNGFVQTFPAVLSKAAMPFLRAELESGRGSCIAAFRAAGAALGMSVLPVELLAQAATVEDPADLPPAFWFLNVNTPQDLSRAEQHIRHRIA